MRTEVAPLSKNSSMLNVPSTDILFLACVRIDINVPLFPSIDRLLFNTWCILLCIFFPGILEVSGSMDEEKLKSCGNLVLSETHRSHMVGLGAGAGLPVYWTEQRGSCVRVSD